MKANLGLSDKGRKAVCAALAPILADIFLLSLKTQNFHWNLVGPRFAALHALFGEQYEAHHDAADEIAERMRALGGAAPGGFASFLKLATLKEATGKENETAMLRQLAADNDALTQACRKAKDIAEANGDAETGDLMIERMTEQAKFAWMLRSHFA